MTFTFIRALDLDICRVFCMTATFHAIRVIKRFECCFHIFSISDFNLANNLLVSTSRTDFAHRQINYFVSLIIVNNYRNYYSPGNMSR